MAGLLTLSSDVLKGDQLKNDPLKMEYDPVSKKNSKRVRYASKQLGGLLVHPEEEEAMLNYKSKMDSAVAEQRQRMKEYEEQQNSLIGQARSDAEGRISSYEDKARGGIKDPRPKLIPIRVVGADGNTVEGTYMLPEDVARQIAEQQEFVSGKNDDGSFNVSVRTKHGYTRGQELHDALREGTQQLGEYDKLYDEQVRAQNAMIDAQVNAAQQGINSQVNQAYLNRDQQLGFAGQTISQVVGRWEQMLADRQGYFAAGNIAAKETISSLLASGVLQKTGRVA